MICGVENHQYVVIGGDESLDFDSWGHGDIIKEGAICSKYLGYPDRYKTRIVVFGIIKEGNR